MITHDLRVMADAMLDKKAQRVVSIDLRPLETAITDHFMICNADSTTAVSAIADNIIEKMQDVGRSPFRKQGMENNFWIILDYGDIVAHIFLTEYRNFYRLEDLWADAPHKEYNERKVPASKTKKTK
ncbi:MAG: ribosome silencing factor [Candidatus Cryptobacteroides sp.]|jgi:ribosome-associated protein|nr:ribosome silencing factor [Bacteroidota bacterium]NLO00229.1 ribosome silencing factor [Bacteroidales bacterium]